MIDRRKQDTPGDRLDRIASSAPVDRMAARVIARGVPDPDWRKTNRHDGTQQHWEAPPLTLSVPVGCLDRTGAKWGNLRVIGYLGRHGNKGARWLVRCVCGRYESRRSRTVERAPADDRCRRCSYQRDLVAGHVWGNAGTKGNKL